jgi:soluble P-type ATPase
LVKVSLYIDDVTWKRFREQVFTKHGTLRRLSDEVESLICSEDIAKSLAVSAKELGISIDRVFTPAELKRIRPKLRGAVAETLVRQLRDQRYGGRLPRH